MRETSLAILPCPFCEAPETFAVTLTPGVIAMQCRRCSAQGPWAVTAAEATLAWASSTGSGGWQVCPSCVHHWIEHRKLLYPPLPTDDVENLTEMGTWHWSPPQIALCPFCGLDAAQPRELTVGMVLVGCDVCRANGPWGGTIREALNAWAAATIQPRCWARCLTCHHVFQPHRPGHHYCTPLCRNRAWRHTRKAA